MIISCGRREDHFFCIEFIIFAFLLLPGFEGSTCERNIDDCPNHRCQNGGVCVDGVNTYNCRCPPQWTGMYGVAKTRMGHRLVTRGRP